MLLSRIQPSDGGPIYSETDLEKAFVEPWNALSSLLFLIPALYWGIKLRGKYTSYPFLTFCIPLLFLGGLGSTLYHAFRNSAFFLMLDVLPITILTLSVSIFFWIRVTKKWWQAVLFIIVPVYLIQYFIYQSLEGQKPININYFITGVNIFLPILIILVKTNMKHAKYIILAIFFFSLGLVCRELDDSRFIGLPMGTHFLWHAFTATGAFLLSEYLYRYRNISILQKLEVKKSNSNKPLAEKL